MQDVTDRIDKAYKLFWTNLKNKRKTAPPNFKKVRKYKSYTLKQAGWKLDEENGAIYIAKQKYRYFKSRNIENPGTEIAFNQRTEMFAEEKS